MDVEQEELQFLGLFGIFNESYKIIISWRKIFSQITLSLILPLAFVFLAHREVTQILVGKIITNETNMMETDVGSRKYNRLNHIVASERSVLYLIRYLYLTLFLVFSLLSTSAVVYTVASIYTGREVSFRRTMSVVPKVWKRVMVTFLCTFLAFFVYNVLAAFVMISWVVISLGFNGTLMVTGVVILSLGYLAGFLYMSFVWHLASVISVLEDFKGFQAMNKSKALMKGKMGIAICIFLILGLLSLAVLFAFQILVVDAASVGMVAKAFFAILCFLLQVKLFLFGLVIHTVLYLVCKSYHHENIDKSALSDHLEVYLLGEYVPLKSKDVQLQQV